MRRFCQHLGWRSIGPWRIGLVVFFVLFALPHESVRAFTESLGQPYHGRLMNGIPFPGQFDGYNLREPEHTYTTPEVIGALLDAIEAVRQQYPKSCDLYLGDFSHEGGGWFNHHRSHQNGRDVDIGMYAKENHPLSTFVPMNEENLDVAKTWCLMENILRSQRVQYIFLDKRIQRLVYDYALSQGVDRTYLDHLFGNTRGSIIKHVAHHYDHMHVRFFTPWSTMAAHVGNIDSQKRAVIEMAQQAYLPKKVLYYAKGTERGVDALAQSFGVSRKDLCRWNQMHGNEILTPGSCLVFYKRGFELEPVHLAQSIVPDSVPETTTVQVASLGSPGTLSDVAPAIRSPHVRDRRPDSPVIITCTVRRGDTLERIAKRNGMELKALCELNRMKKNAVLHPGQKIKLVSVKPSRVQSHKQEAEFARSSNAPSSTFGRDSRHASSRVTTYTVAKGDTLAKIAHRKRIGLDELCRMNGLKKNSALKPGQKLKLTALETRYSSSSDKTVALTPRKSSTPRIAVSHKTTSHKKMTPHTTSRASKTSSSSKTASSKSKIKSEKSSKKPVAKHKKGSSNAKVVKAKKNMS